jgi:hypothetical protein
MSWARPEAFARAVCPVATEPESETKNSPLNVSWSKAVARQSPAMRALNDISCFRAGAETAGKAVRKSLQRQFCRCVRRHVGKRHSITVYGADLASSDLPGLSARARNGPLLGQLLTLLGSPHWPSGRHYPARSSWKTCLLPEGKRPCRQQCQLAHRFVGQWLRRQEAPGNLTCASCVMKLVSYQMFFRGCC